MRTVKATMMAIMPANTPTAFMGFSLVTIRRRPWGLATASGREVPSAAPAWSPQDRAGALSSLRPDGFFKLSGVSRP